MLQIKGISKSYITGELTQHALKSISLNFREKEFVSILGPSGSGKTTLLNIIGGLDQYDSGDLIINNISTQKYKDRDWDSYRNHSIGFIFQSYNLIPHQSILANVELALALSGISKRERIQRAKKVLDDVGLAQHIHKRPNQLSGGQMQRVAIARALVNNPDILLADEPTGALDSETSIQIMNLLKDVAKDRLVIMVTHNPELAEEYATRTIKLRDGEIISDSDAFNLKEDSTPPPSYQNLGKSSMKFTTSLVLSFNNLRTKKGRTILTAFAGSIGIIGIALILSLSNGVNSYIYDIQRDTMSAYPIVIDSETMDMTQMMEGRQDFIDMEMGMTVTENKITSNSNALTLTNTFTTSVEENNLTDFKSFLDAPDSPIQPFLGENGIHYSYDILFDVYSKNTNEEFVSLLEETETLSTNNNEAFSSQIQLPIDDILSSNYFEELLPGADNELISSFTKDSYDVLAGEWPNAYDEVMIVLDSNNRLSLHLLYTLGLVPADDYQNLVDLANSSDPFVDKVFEFDYEDVLDASLHLIANSSKYVLNDHDLYEEINLTQTNLEKIIQDGLDLKVTGVIRPIEGADNATLTGSIVYTNELTNYLMDVALNSQIVLDQQANPKTNILNGLAFEPATDEEKISDTITYLMNLGVSEKAAFMQQMATASLEQAGQFSAMSELELANMFDVYLENPDEQLLLTIYEESISQGSYSENLYNFGFISLDAPTSISIFTDTFEDKEGVTDTINDYNDAVDEEDKIIYTDFVAIMISSMTTIIDVITYVLIAFVAISLVVSSIMIGIITYISVVERTKEIGILRAMGASKRNISQVFNAETFIIGTLSGTLAIAVTLILLIPINSIIQLLIEDESVAVAAALPISNGVALIILSIILTLIGGYIPAKKAALKDPVSALRTE